MMYATFDENGLPTGFYCEAIHGTRLIDGRANTACKIPVEAVEITDEQYTELVVNQGERKLINGEVVEYIPPTPVPTISDYQKAIQSQIDAKAQEKQYNNSATLASYVNSTVAAWAAEAQAFVAWRDQVWAYALAELDKVQSGEREQPSVEAFLTELPVFEWA